MSYGNPYSAPQTPLNIPVANESYPPELRYVADGFALQSWVIRAYLIGVLSFLGLTWMAANQMVELTPTTITIFGIIFAIVLFTLQLLAFVNFNKSPAETGARGTSNFGMIMFIVGIVFYLLSLAVIYFQMIQSPYPIAILMILAGVCLMASALTLMIYFRQIASYLQDVFATYITNSLVNATIVLYICIALVVVMALSTGNNPLLQRGGGGREMALPVIIISAISAIGAGLLSIYVAIVYLATIGGMKRLLQSKMRQY